MLKRKYFVIAFLAFCLTATLFLGVTTSNTTESGSDGPPYIPYDPRIDVNGDGVINVLDMKLVKMAHGSSGTPINKTWDEIVERGEIRVGSSPDWPPFEYLDPDTGEIVGFEVDIMEEVMRRLSLEEGVTITVDWVSMAFVTIIEGVVAGTVDLGVSGFSITPARWERVQYCTPHYITDAQVLALNSTVAAAGIPPEGLGSLAELKDYGLSCGVESGTAQEAELIAAGVTTVSYVDYWAAMDDMVAEVIDTVYAESPVSYYWIEDYAKQTPPIGMQIIFSRPSWPVAFMAHHDSDVLVAKISGQIAVLLSEGWIEEKIVEYGMVY